MNGRSWRDSSGRCTTFSALFSVHVRNSDLTLAFAAWSVRSIPSTSATAEPAQPLAVGLCRHSPAAIAFWTRNKFRGDATERGRPFPRCHDANAITVPLRAVAELHAFDLEPVGTIGRRCKVTLVVECPEMQPRIVYSAILGF